MVIYSASSDRTKVGARLTIPEMGTSDVRSSHERHIMTAIVIFTTASGSAFHRPKITDVHRT